mgnify:CR=1 FL=1|jgi:hypothetical protein
MLIRRKLLKKYFQISEDNGLLKLRYRKGKNPIFVDKRFQLNEDSASLAGLMPDGSLIKDLRRIYFHQKKDIRKIYLFKNTILKLFRPKNKIFIRDNRGTIDIFINSQTLAMFFYKILKIPKSDEQMRVPNWIFRSPKKVKIAYLKQAFDMEATINKGLSDIRFITKDYNFAVDIRRLLKQVGVTSFVKNRIGGTYNTLQYQVCIYKKENFSKFKKIGFSIKFNKDRFQKMVKKYNI